MTGTGIIIQRLAKVIPRAGISHVTRLFTYIDVDMCIYYIFNYTKKKAMECIFMNLWYFQFDSRTSGAASTSLKPEAINRSSF